MRGLVLLSRSIRPVYIVADVRGFFPQLPDAHGRGVREVPPHQLGLS